MRHGLYVVVKHAQLINQRGDVLIDRVLYDGVLLRTNGIGNTSPRERVVGLTG